MIQGIKNLGWIVLALLVLCLIFLGGAALVIVVALLAAIGVVLMTAGLLKAIFTAEDDSKDQY